ncbi:hypothetical protein [Sphingobium aromaticiconvertens]|uniref:hypothetical protein n=1 Tax=Sphingobium aromaticiconvertens TaxID=365341 RepID=UPI003018979D
MKLEDIGDPALIERVGRIVYAAYPPEEMDFAKWLNQCRADEQGAYHLGIFACDVLDERDITEEQRSDLTRYSQLMALALDVVELHERALNARNIPALME